MIADQRAGVHEEVGARRERSGGTFSSVASPETKLAEVQGKRCFQTDGYSVGDRGLHQSCETPAERDTISLPRYPALGDAAARRVQDAPRPSQTALLDYFTSRKTLGGDHPSLLRRSRLEVAARATPVGRTRALSPCCASG